MHPTAIGRRGLLASLLGTVLLVLAFAETARDQGTGGGLLFPGEAVLLVMADAPPRFTPVAEEAVVDPTPALRQVFLDPAAIPYQDLISGFPAGIQIKPFQIDAQAGLGITIVRYPNGYIVPRHFHGREELVFYLQGTHRWAEFGPVSPGKYFNVPIGIAHGPIEAAGEVIYFGSEPFPIDSNFVDPPTSGPTPGLPPPPLDTDALPWIPLETGDPRIPAGAFYRDLGPNVSAYPGGRVFMLRLTASFAWPRHMIGAGLDMCVLQGSYQVANPLTGIHVFRQGMYYYQPAGLVISAGSRGVRFTP